MNGGQQRRITVYVDESGRGRPDNQYKENQPYFIVGVLLTDRAAELSAIVDEVCREENFRRELHWRHFNRTSARVYVRVAARLDREAGWEYKATRFAAEQIDFRHHGCAEKFDAQRVHHIYNNFVRKGVDAALEVSEIVEGSEIEIILDEKKRTREDDFAKYLKEHYEKQYPGVSVIVRDAPSESERMLQLCDIVSGAHNSLIVRACGQNKLTAAEEIWLARCQEWEFPLTPYAEPLPETK